LEIEKEPDIKLLNKKALKKMIIKDMIRVNVSYILIVVPGKRFPGIKTEVYK